MLLSSGHTKSKNKFFISVKWNAEDFKLTLFVTAGNCSVVPVICVWEEGAGKLCLECVCVCEERGRERM